jgi:hypothetical protein
LPLPGASYFFIIAALARFRSFGGDYTDQVQGFPTWISYLMFLMAGDKDHTAGLDRMPAALCVDFACTGMHEYSMFPRVRMPRALGSGRKFYDSHTKIVGAAVFADHYPKQNSCQAGAFITVTSAFIIISDLHIASIIEKPVILPSRLKRSWG